MEVVISLINKTLHRELKIKTTEVEGHIGGVAEAEPTITYQYAKSVEKLVILLPIVTSGMTKTI